MPQEDLVTTFFENNSQKINQWSRTRRNGAKPSGVVVLHTAESATDFLGPDPGAENVARYFSTTNRYASYHHLSDSDSSIQLAPWSAETWHDTGTNNHSVGISAAIQCKDWKKLGERGERIVKRMAAGAASYAKWLKKYHGITIPARRISAAQSRARVPGFLGHGTSDPGRRSDPGVDFDWGLFFAEYTRLMGGGGEVKPTTSLPATKPAGKAPRNSKADNKAIQQALAYMLIDVGFPDGVDGPKQKAGVEVFQRAHGLVPDGYWGPKTQAKYKQNLRIQNAIKAMAGVPDDWRSDGFIGSTSRKWIAYTNDRQGWAKGSAVNSKLIRNLKAAKAW